MGLSAKRSVLIAGGKVTIEKPVKRARPIPELENQVFENSHNPLDFVKFFELSDVGIHVEPVDNGVKVRTLEAKSPLAEAGVRGGDVITRVGKHLVKSAEDLRQRLRDASATRGAAVLSVRRGEMMLEVQAAIPS